MEKQLHLVKFLVQEGDNEYCIPKFIRAKDTKAVKTHIKKYVFLRWNARKLGDCYIAGCGNPLIEVKDIKVISDFDQAVSEIGMLKWQ